VTACWRCAAARPEGVFCPVCGTIQPLIEADHFARLGLERAFSQDPKAMEATHRALQRDVHPDRFVSRDPEEQAYALAWSTAQNDAFTVVRDPQLRAEYLLELLGLDVPPEEGRIRLRPAFLMELLELREAALELRGQDAHVERGRLAREVAARYEATLAELGAILDEGDETRLERALVLLGELRSLRKVLDELEEQDD